MSYDPHDPLPHSGDGLGDSRKHDAPGGDQGNQPPSESSTETAATDQATSSGASLGENTASSNRPRILIGSQRDPAAYRPRPGKPVTPARPRPSLPESTRPGRLTGSPAGASAGEKSSPESSPQPTQVQVLAGDAVANADVVRDAAAISEPVQGPVPSREVDVAASGNAETGTFTPSDQSPGGRLTATEEKPARVFSALPDFPEDEVEEEHPEKILASEIDQLRQQVRDSAQILTREAVQDLFNRRAGLPPDLEKEFAEALGDVAVEQLITETASKVKVGQLEPESRHVGKVLAVRGENVFVELGLREQGIVPLKLFREPPQVGQSVEVRVVRFVPEEGVYELVLPAAAADVADWADLSEGMLVEARVTGVNQGGLECEVNRIRGFIPISQIDIFRVEKPEEYVGQSFTCVVLEADPQRKNLVLSRRAVLEREREQVQRLLWDSLTPGQIRDGVVRRITEFGAFVDLGGVDGLLHISQIAWGRIKHPSEVLREGQTIKVRIDKVDRENQRISLGYRDLLYNPWEDADKKYVPQSLWKGRVTRIMDFGAFVELEPGVEGLVHISELSTKRVSRVRDVVKEGDEVDVVVLAFDPQEKKISLSIRAAMKMKEPEPTPQPESAETSTQTAEPAAPPPPPKKQKPPKPLKGGLGSSPGQSLLDLLKK
jgi:small subunit ribosomal protein S1